MDGFYPLPISQLIINRAAVTHVRGLKSGGDFFPLIKSKHHMALAAFAVYQSPEYGSLFRTYNLNQELV